MDSTGIVPTMPITGYGDGFGGSSGGLWLFAILALMLGGGNGFFGRGNAYPTDYARQSDVVYTSAFNQLQDENSNIINNTQRLATELQQALYNASYNNLSEVKTLEGNVAELGARQQECCCSILRGIDGVNYNGALNTASINANTTAQVQKVLDKLAEDKISALQGEVDSLKLAQATQNVVRFPTSFTFPAANPFGWFGGNNGNI